MKITFRIWITSLIIQPLLFCLVFFPAAVIVIPIEIIGSIPGILIFGIIVQILIHIKAPAWLKWSLLILCATGLAFLSSLLFLVGADTTQLDNAEDFLFMIPAPMSVLIAIILNGNTISQHLEHAPKRIRQEAYYPD